MPISSAGISSCRSFQGVWLRFLSNQSASISAIDIFMNSLG